MYIRNMHIFFISHVFHSGLIRPEAYVVPLRLTYNPSVALLFFVPFPFPERRLKIIILPLLRIILKDWDKIVAVI